MEGGSTARQDSVGKVKSMKTDRFRNVLAGFLAAGVALASSCSSTPELDETGSRLMTWTSQDSGSTASLRGVCAVDGRVAWASGSDGTVLRTLDGGDHWESVKVAGLTHLDYRDVHAFDAQRAWVVSAGLPAVICYTSNGGRSWKVQYRSDVAEVFFDAIDFWDARHGIAFSDPVDGKFLILVTDDGGALWQAIPRDALPRPVDGEAGFAASGTCLRAFGERHAWIGTGGGASRIVRSDDRGKTWSVSASGLGHGPSAGVFSIAFSDELLGVAVGGDYKNEAGSRRVAAWTEDGGRSWNVIERGGPSGFRSAVTRIGESGTTFLAVGPSGTDISTDAGRTWHRLSDKGFHAISCAGRDCWAVGSGGRISRMSSGS